LDVGTFLTFVALVVGFLGWAYKAIKEWRRDARRAAESGALRLLLKILREHYARGAGPMSLSELRAEFERPGREAERRAYCERDFHFEDDDHFERAVYELQWEFKIDFSGGDKVIFRTAPGRDQRSRDPFIDIVDPRLVVSSFEEALADDDIRSFDLERLARMAAAVSPDAARKALLRAIDTASGDSGTLRRLLILTDELGHR
jgi:hypothetical protein